MVTSGMTRRIARISLATFTDLVSINVIVCKYIDFILV